MKIKWISPPPTFQYCTLPRLDGRYDIPQPVCTSAISASHHQLAWLVVTLRKVHLFPPWKFCLGALVVESWTFISLTGLILFSWHSSATTATFTEIRASLNETSYVQVFFLSRLTCGDVKAVEHGRLLDFVT